MTPTESQPQHLAALEYANEIKSARAALKRSVRAGTTTIPEALNDPCAQTMTIESLLRQQKRWGNYPKAKGSKALELLAQIPITPIAPYRQVHELTERQRRIICDELSAKRRQG